MLNSLLQLNFCSVILDLIRRIVCDDKYRQSYHKCQGQGAEENQCKDGRNTLQIIHSSNRVRRTGIDLAKTFGQRHPEEVWRLSEEDIVPSLSTVHHMGIYYPIIMYNLLAVILVYYIITLIGE